MKASIRAAAGSMSLRRLGLCGALVAAALACLSACSEATNEGGSGGASSSASGAGSGGTSVVSGSVTSSSASGGPGTLGASATELTAAGHMARSPKYRLEFAAGQSTLHQGTAAAKHRYFGGVVGANEGEMP